MAALYDSVTEEEDDEGRDAAFSPGDDSQSKPQRRTTPPRQAKRGHDTASDSSSKAKPKRASSPPKKRAKSGNGKKPRPGQERKQTALARKSYGSLNYAPNLAKDEDVQALRERWNPVAFRELMDIMFEDRSKFLILHVRDDLPDVARESLDAIVAFMSVHRRAFWWFGHW
ncbi:hypothetical protein PHMEG_00041862, partial [Phytophthora megakarya]